jgi:hypothetical protein
MIGLNKIDRTDRGFGNVGDEKEEMRKILDNKTSLGAPHGQ